MPSNPCSALGADLPPRVSLAGIISNTSPFNLTGHPALTIPCGFVAAHQDDILSAEDVAIQLPVGLMIVGKMWEEGKVLQVGDAWEQAFDWKKM